MPLPTHALEAIQRHVRGGLHDREKILEILCEEIYAPGEINAQEAAKAVDTAFQLLEKEKTTWPKITDCDRLDRAFAALNKAGIIALQNAGMTMSDGISDVSEALAVVPDPARISGYCFYNGQDLERAVEGDGLDFAFGSVKEGAEQTLGITIGRQIATEFRRNGFTVEWNGTHSQRIRIANFDWKRR